MLNKNNTDSLYLFGQRKLNITAITSIEYMMLKLNKVNADINLETQQLKRHKAMVELNIFLELPRETQLSCQHSSEIPALSISASRTLSKALENNPDMIVLKQKLIESQKAIKSENSNRLTAIFSANIGVNQNQEKLSEAYRDLRDKQGISFTLSKPIIDWAKTEEQYNKQS